MTFRPLTQVCKTRSPPNRSGLVVRGSADSTTKSAAAPSDITPARPAIPNASAAELVRVGGVAAGDALKDRLALAVLFRDVLAL